MGWALPERAVRERDRGRVRDVFSGVVRFQACFSQAVERIAVAGVMRQLENIFHYL